MATLKDVAQKTGLAVTTVSRVLNNRGYISEATREAVYSAMRELNYQPNELARSLVKKRTDIIGVIVPSVMHPFFSKVVYYLESYAMEKGFKLMLCNSQHQKEKEFEYLDMLRSNQVAGIILCSRTPGIEKHLDLDLPVVTFERSVSVDIPAVMCDNYQGGELATLHLLKQGCKKLLHFSGIKEVQMPADQRCSAFLDICREHMVQGKVIDTSEAQFNSMDYASYIEKVLLENPGIDGIFCSSDVIAAEVLQVCWKIGIRVPQDLKLVGFDDTDVSQLTTPPLTTIQQPVELMCRYAVDNILYKLQQEVAPSRTVLPVHLVQRGTTALPEKEASHV